MDIVKESQKDEFARNYTWENNRIPEIIEVKKK